MSGATRHAIGLRQDEQRPGLHGNPVPARLGTDGQPMYPVRVWSVPNKPFGAGMSHPDNPAAGVTFHAYTAKYDAKRQVQNFHAGQAILLTEAQVAGIKAALKIETGPVELIEREDDNGKAIRRRTSIHGRGLVVQWFEVRDDAGQHYGWRTTGPIDLANPEYQPLENPDDEVPLHQYVALESVRDEAWSPRAIDLSSLTRNAGAIENEEKTRDPVAFERQTARAARAKSTGTPLTAE